MSSKTLKRYLIASARYNAGTVCSPEQTPHNSDARASLHLSQFRYPHSRHSETGTISDPQTLHRLRKAFSDLLFGVF